MYLYIYIYIYIYIYMYIYSVGPASLTSYCKSILDSGHFRFACPAVLSITSCDTLTCNREWPFFVVRHVACLTPDEEEKFEKKISQNYLLKKQGIEQCPGCL